ncbi:MAG: energy transducer TonB [Flavobacteriales bacterium]
MPQIYASKTLPMTRLPIAFCSILFAAPLFPQGSETSQPLGGQQAIDLLLEQDLNYPIAALEVGLKGDVIVRLHVLSSGTVTAIGVERSLSPECDAEAMRLMRLVRWRPSTSDDERGTADHYLTVTFDPGKYRRWVKARPKRDAAVFGLPASDSLAVFAAKQLEQQPAPLIAGGMTGLAKHIGTNMRYPDEAYRRSIEGVVRLDFVVEASGVVSNMRAIEELGGGCTAEATRLLSQIAWTPGVLGGQRVRSSVQVSIRFTLPEHAR